MDWKWDRELRPGMAVNPVVFAKKVELPANFIFPKDAELAEIFTTGKPQLKTWGRGATLINDPHWIGVRGGTPLHIDPRYPRYTHQLKVRVDPGIFCRGIDLTEQKLERGLFYILDAHSPHQILSKNDKLAYNISISIDSKEVLDADECIRRCIEYGLTEPLISEIYK